MLDEGVTLFESEKYICYSIISKVLSQKNDILGNIVNI